MVSTWAIASWNIPFPASKEYGMPSRYEFNDYCLNSSE
jgi:hypothetical protein